MCGVLCGVWRVVCGVCGLWCGVMCVVMFVCVGTDLVAITSVLRARWQLWRRLWGD